MADIELIQKSWFYFQLLTSGLTPVSLLESESGFEIVMKLVNTGKRPSSHLSSKNEPTNFIHVIAFFHQSADDSFDTSFPISEERNVHFYE
jgi:hypothetical protein